MVFQCLGASDPRLASGHTRSLTRDLDRAADRSLCGRCSCGPVPIVVQPGSARPWAVRRASFRGHVCGLPALPHVHPPQHAHARVHTHPPTQVTYYRAAENPWPSSMLPQAPSCSLEAIPPTWSPSCCPCSTTQYGCWPAGDTQQRPPAMPSLASTQDCSSPLTG